MTLHSVRLREKSYLAFCYSPTSIIVHHGSEERGYDHHGSMEHFGLIHGTGEISVIGFVLS